MVVVALPITVKTQRQSKCQLMGECIKKMWCIPIEISIIYTYNGILLNHIKVN